MKTRKNRETGTMVSVGRTLEDFGIEHEPNEGWMTLCEDHGNLVTHKTRQLAEWHAPSPSGWCDKCRDMIYGKTKEPWEAP